jgi:ribosome recycling factor
MSGDIKNRMDNTLNSFRNDLKGLRTGRATPALLDSVVVDVYGSKMPINQVATVNAPEARMLSVEGWDQGNVAAVEKGISTAGLGLNPISEGALIRVPLPDLSEERRKELVKVAGQYAEKARIAIRNIRRDEMDSLKKQEKDGEISQDEQHAAGDDVQKTTDDFIKQIDETLAAKEKDILEV